MGAPPQILLGNLGMADSLILMVLALVVFGPRRLPQIGRQIGKLMYEFRKASNDFKFQMEEELRISEDADRRKKDEAERARSLALNPPAPSVEAQADIGAVEQASVSAPPPPYGGEPENAPVAETAQTESEPRIYPRIAPPSTGEPIAASRYGAARPFNSDPAPEPAPETVVAAEANVGAEPASTAAEPPATHDTASEPNSDPASEPTRTEPVSQHG